MILSDTAIVVDGDTLRLGQERVRLNGIDAPERRQTCGAAACGETARAWLARLIEGKLVICEGSTRDKYRRLVAVCRVDGADLGQAIVKAGWAVAYRRYSAAYVPAEQDAQRARRGLWASGFDLPADWRRAHRIIR